MTFIDSYFNGAYRRTVNGTLIKELQHSGFKWGIIENEEVLKNGQKVPRFHLINMGRVGDHRKRYDPKHRFPQNGVVKKPNGKPLREKRV